MDSSERNRIDGLLLSIEREEESEPIRPLGVFPRELFPDEDNSENVNINDNDDTEDLEGILVLDQDDNVENIPLENVNQQADNTPNNLLEKDLGDLANIPEHSRNNDFIVKRMNGRLAYLSKDSKMLWDIQPTQQSLARNRNIMRMGIPSNSAKNAQNPVQAW